MDDSEHFMFFVAAGSCSCVRSTRSSRRHALLLLTLFALTHFYFLRRAQRKKLVGRREVCGALVILANFQRNSLCSREYYNDDDHVRLMYFCVWRAQIISVEFLTTLTDLLLYYDVPMRVTRK